MSAMSPEDLAMEDGVLKERTYFASGACDGMAILKALGLETKHVTKLVITIDSSNIIDLQVTHYMTRGQVADLAAELTANPIQLKEEK